MNGLQDGLLRFLTWFSKQHIKYKEIKRDEDLRRTSVRFGVNALLFVLIGFPLAVGVAFCGVALVQVKEVFSIIFGVMLVVVGGLCVLMFFIYALVSAIYQLRLNRRAIGFISLALCFIVTAAAAVVVYSFANNIF